jgi:hypothetical protein
MLRGTDSARYVVISTISARWGRRWSWHLHDQLCPFLLII